MPYGLPAGLFRHCVFIAEQYSCYADNLFFAFTDNVGKSRRTVFVVMIRVDVSPVLSRLTGNGLPILKRAAVLVYCDKKKSRSLILLPEKREG